MQSKLFIALPILIVLSACSEKATTQDHSPEPSGEIGARERNEMTGAESHADAADIELREPVGLD